MMFYWIFVMGIRFDAENKEPHFMLTSHAVKLTAVKTYSLVTAKPETTMKSVF